jgi:hypothetical protein
MKRKRLSRAAALAVDLAVDLDARLPCTMPAGELLAAVMPLAVSLERLERNSARDRKRAKAYRKAVKRARCEVEQLLASQDGRLVSLPRLLATVPYSVDMWRLALVPGAPAEDFAAESEAA